MTEREILRALSQCADHSCNAKCPAFPAGLDCREEMHKEVLALLERLTAENAALREKQRWILVTERLPEKQQRVIVRCKTVGTTVGWIMFGEWVTDLGPGCGEVTHWMPLPGAPEGDKA